RVERAHDAHGQADLLNRDFPLRARQGSTSSTPAMLPLATDFQLEQELVFVADTVANASRFRTVGRTNLRFPDWIKGIGVGNDDRSRSYPVLLPQRFQFRVIL